MGGNGAKFQVLIKMTSKLLTGHRGRGNSPLHAWPQSLGSALVRETLKTMEGVHGALKDRWRKDLKLRCFVISTSHLADVLWFWMDWWMHFCWVVFCFIYKSHTMMVLHFLFKYKGKIHHLFCMKEIGRAHVWTPVTG